MEPYINNNAAIYPSLEITMASANTLGLSADVDTLKSLPLLRGKSVTLETALRSDDNVLQELTYPEQERKFFEFIHVHKSDIRDIVSSHLGLSSPDNCHLIESGWLCGSFNACLPVAISDPHYSAQRVMLRIPLPYKVGEKNHPGNAEEKLRCELATYIWMSQHCPRVPIPSLLGFGFASGLNVSAICPCHC